MGDREQPSKDPKASVERPRSETLPFSHGMTHLLASVRRFRLTVVEGPKKGLSFESTQDGCSVGSHPTNDLVIDDPTVSRFHCEVQMTPDGPSVRDLHSKNGTILDGVQVKEGFLRPGMVVSLGASALRFQLGSQNNQLPISQKTSFGSLVGGSVVMRSAFALLERAAASSATVLLEGETGTGKGKAAEAIHQQSARKNGPLVVVDCGAIPENLLESELFGHEKGSFTGAVERHIGAFEEASGGTVFLDEVGELSPDLQPKLLRVLENREVKRIGTNIAKQVDVRVIAATNRDLRAEVNAGRFRPDLYYRLAVVKIVLPPLRQRPEDTEAIIKQLLPSLGVEPQSAGWLQTPEFLATVKRAAWPGNVRELRNYLERCAVFGSAVPTHDGEEGPVTPDAQPVDLSMPFLEARDRVTGTFERRYLSALLTSHKWKVSEAARAAGIDRVFLWRLVRKHGLQNPNRS